MKIIWNEDGTATIQIGGGDRFKLNADGTVQSAASPSNTDDSKKLVTTELLRDLALGVDQTWQVLSGSRALGTTYTNTTGKPIAVAVGISAAGQGSSAVLYVDNQVVDSTASYAAIDVWVKGVIPVGATYRVASGSTLAAWRELR